MYRIFHVGEGYIIDFKKSVTQGKHGLQIGGIPDLREEKWWKDWTAKETHEERGAGDITMLIYAD